MTFQKQDLHLLKKKTITNDCLKKPFLASVIIRERLKAYTPVLKTTAGQWSPTVVTVFVIAKKLRKTATMTPTNKH